MWNCGHINLKSTSSCGLFTLKMRPTHQWKLYQHATKSMLLTFWNTVGEKSYVAELFKSEQMYLHPIWFADIGDKNDVSVFQDIKYG